MREHPGSEEIVAYLEGGLPPPERSSIEAHLAECRPCRREATEVGLFLRGRRRRRTRRVAATAAAAAIAAVVALVIVAPWKADDSVSTVLRTRPGAEEGLPRIEALMPVQDEVVSVDSIRFGWRPVAADAFYRLTVMDDAGGPVWEATTPDTLLAPPSSAPLEAGRRYFWYVDAALPDGGEATTGVRGFRTEAP